MKKAVIVIGSNYGDEGKGLAAASAAAGMKGNVLNILINGGAQRGHTIEFPDGRRHVFHHFGSASVYGAASCADEDFMVNPILFLDEKEELQKEMPEASLRFLASVNCRVTTVFDMMVNQYVEDYRGHVRHGSCGLGIFETRRRYEKTDWALKLGELFQLEEADYYKYCRRITREYIPARMENEGIPIDLAWYELLCREGMEYHSWQAICHMKQMAELYEDWRIMAANWQNLIFEAGQGLALDEDNRFDFPHLTPSHTTSLISARRIQALKEETDTEILYVTRTYLTRHGAGPLPTECPMEEISPEIRDLTNMPNPYQQTIRYGYFDAQAVKNRILCDMDQTKKVLPMAKTALMVTHMNETNEILFKSAENIQQMAEMFDHLYTFDEKYPSVLKNVK